MKGRTNDRLNGGGLKGRTNERKKSCKHLQVMFYALVMADRRDHATFLLFAKINQNNEGRKRRMDEGIEGRMDEGKDGRKDEEKKGSTPEVIEKEAGKPKIIPEIHPQGCQNRPKK